MDAVAQAHRNLKLIYVLKIFTKRVFFPIVPIYLVTQLDFSIQEIGVVSVWFSLVSIITNVPDVAIAILRLKFKQPAAYGSNRDYCYAMLLFCKR